MSADPLSLDPSGVSKFVSRALATASAAELPAIVVLAEERDPVEIRLLLMEPSVAGVIVSPSVATNFTGDPRVGMIRGDGRWRMPAAGGRSLLLLTGGRLLNIKRSFQALRVGTRNVLTLHNLETLNRVELSRWILRRSGAVLGAGLGKVSHGRSPFLSPLYQRRIANKLMPLLSQSRVEGGDECDSQRILLVNNSLAAGGAERQLVNTALALSNDGCDVAIQCNHLGTEEYDFYRPVLDSKVPVSVIRGLLDIRAGLDPARLDPLDKAMHSAGLAQLESILPVWIVDDVVQHAVNLLVNRPSVVHYWQDYTNVVGGLAAALVGIPKIVLGMRNMAPFRFPYFDPIMAPIYKVLSRCPNVQMVNNSSAGASDYASWLGFERGQIEVVLNGVAGLERPSKADVLNWRSRLGLQPGDPVIGSVFRFWPEKDPMLWVETAAAVAARRPRTRFLLVGDGPLRTDIERRARELGLGSRLILPGTMDNPELAISSMTAFLLSSRVEGTPNVLIEAQHLGCPVVTTIAGGSAETIVDGYTGWAVAQRSAEALATRLVQVLDDCDWRRQASRAAPVFARQRFGIERMVELTKSIYGIDR